MRNDTTPTNGQANGPDTPAAAPQKSRRILSSLRLTLAVTFLAGLIAYLTPLALTRLVGQDMLRAQAQAALQGALYRPVDIKGEVRLTLIPWFGLRTGPVTVANSPGFGPQPLVSVESSTIELNLLALVRKRIVVDSVSLSSATLNLERDAQGQENWRTPQPVDVSSLPLPPAPSGWEAQRLPTGLRLWNASVHFTDQLTGSNIDVRRLNLNTTPASPFDFSVSCELTVLPLGIKGEVHAQGQGSYGPTGGHVFVRSSQAAGWLDLPEADGRPGGRMQFSGRLGFHGEAGAFEISQLVLEGLGARVTGQINAAGIYENTPYMALNLAATASRHGAWAALLGVDPADAPALRAPNGRETPTLRRAPDEADVEAALVLNYGPAGWKAESFSLRHEQGRVTGWAGNIGGQLDFDVRADGVDLNRWAPARLPALADSLRGALASGAGSRGLEALHGRFKGRHLRLGEVDVSEVELSAKAENGALRLYPFTARTPQTLLTADLRAALDPGSPGFSCQAALQALAPGHNAPAKAAELSLEGAAKDSGLGGSVRFTLGDLPPGWSPPWLTENLAAAWRALGGGSVSASLRLPGGEDRLAELADLDLRAGGSRITGRAGYAPGRVSLDLAADRLDTERLQQAAALFGPGGDNPLPPLALDGRVAVKRLSTPLGEFDDVQLAGQSGPEALHLGTLTASGLGGRITGSLDYQHSGGRHGGSLTLAASGVHGAQLSALAPQAPRLTGPLEGRISLEASARSGEPLWRAMHGQADLQMGIGTVAFSQDQGPNQAWPLTRTALNLKFASRPANGAEKPREAALAEVTGSLRMESPGQLRSLQTDLKGQAGLGANGKPLWFRQPRLEGSLAVDVPLRPGKPLRATWAGKLDADFEKGSYGITGVDLNMEGVTGKASLTGQPGPGGMQLSGSVDIPEFSPRDAAQRTGIALPAKAAPELWRKARFSTDIGGNLKDVRLTRIQGALDDTTITGAATLTGQTTHADLAVGNLDLDRLFPIVKDDDPAKRPDSPLPMQELRALNMDAKVRLGRLVRDKLVWDSSLLTLTAQGGRFRIMHSSQQFYGGSYMMDVRGDARGQDLKAQFDLALVGFEASPLLRAVAGAETVTRGNGEFHVNVETWGATEKALRSHAAGTARFEVKGGRLVLREPGAASRQLPPPTDAESLPFDSLGAHFTAREGLAISRDLAMLGPDITAKGDGWVSLPDERIDLNLIAVVRDVGELPVRISGPLYDPKVNVDKSRILGETIMKMFKGVITLPASIVNIFRKLY
ncbi:AsmA family protein [Fundidesulfovibrio agrisoli]|uniref:AsmA family protein n=1 Tax=Fundidesulfovibrio agrisoli TaxID=2922717 RepID=UPI001FADA764|nr:AsmA family protein [Fundidesulfovibrio agrisoli]